MKWKIILFMMVMLMLETVYAAPSISLDILSNDTYNTSNSIFNITLSGTECSGGNTSWWNSTGKQQILGLDFNINETDSNFWDYTGNNNNATNPGTAFMFVPNCGLTGNGCIGGYATNSYLNMSYVPQNMSNFTLSLIFNSSVDSDGEGSNGRRYIFGVAESEYMMWFQLQNATTTPSLTYSFGLVNPTATQATYITTSSALGNYSVVFNMTFVFNWLGTRNLNVTLYNNGIYYGSMNHSNVSATRNSLSFFRRKLTSSSGAWNGSIDDVRIYNYALSSQEVSELYNASVAKRSPRLLPQQTTNGDIWQASAVCSNRTAYSTRASEILYISDCITVLANTSYSSWLNISACDFYDHLSQSTNFTTYDTNNCGTFSNITYNATQNTSCVFCAGQNISLCTYQTNKMEGENMLLGLILIPLVLGIMFLAASFFLSEEHTIFKIFLFGLSFISATASLYMASVAMTYLNAAETAVQTAISNTMLWVSWVDFILIIYIFVYITIKILKALKQNNEDKLKY